MSKTVKVGLIGAGFVSDLHAYAFKNFVKDAEIVAVSALDNAKEFAAERGIPCMPMVSRILSKMPRLWQCLRLITRRNLLLSVGFRMRL